MGIDGRYIILKDNFVNTYRVDFYTLDHDTGMAVLHDAQRASMTAGSHHRTDELYEKAMKLVKDYAKYREEQDRSKFEESLDGVSPDTKAIMRQKREADTKDATELRKSKAESAKHKTGMARQETELEDQRRTPTDQELDMRQIERDKTLHQPATLPSRIPQRSHKAHAAAR